MELDKLETTILNDVQIKVDNWKWAKWVHLIVTLSVLVNWLLFSFGVVQTGVIEFFAPIFLGAYLGHIFRSWNGLKKESLFIKYSELAKKNSK
jgi:hypothetical protein